MCGRFSLATSLEILREHFKITQGVSLVPRYNIAPTQRLPVQVKPGSIDFLNWGFVASWATEFVDKKAFINARSETVLEKPFFRQAFLKRRCLILADGFYEWKTMGRVKQPYYICRKDRKPFAMGGIWENDTCAILTTTANSALQSIHERMPVIIPENFYGSWLDPNTEQKSITHLLLPGASEIWMIYPVALNMNNPNFDNAFCREALL
jgi:putative SOS response-associated peptidase YedK